MSLESGYTAELTVHHPTGDITIVMETWEDGNIKANSAKHRDPVTRKETARGGLRSREALKLSRECDSQTYSLVPRLEDACGRDRVTAVKQMVGPRGEVIGEPTTLTGILNDVNPPAYDLAGDGVSMIEFEVDVDE